jgi:aminopeptidase
VTGPDPYVPHRGSAAYRVLRYDLDLDHRPSTNALKGTAVLDVVPLERLDRRGARPGRARVVGVRVDGGARRATGTRRPARRHAREPRRGAPAVEVLVRYSGSPGPQRGPWGEVGWEELADGVLVAGQPDGAPTWFPCNDHPGDKATFRTTVRTDSAYAVVAQRPARRAHARRQPHHLGVRAGGADGALPRDGADRPVRGAPARGRPVPQRLLAPVRLRERARADTGRSPEMLALFSGCSARTRSPVHVVVTDDDLEIPLEAQGISVFGANHVDGAGGSSGSSRTSWRTSGSATA